MAAPSRVLLAGVRVVVYGWGPGLSGSGPSPRGRRTRGVSTRKGGAASHGALRLWVVGRMVAPGRGRGLHPPRAGDGSGAQPLRAIGRGRRQPGVCGRRLSTGLSCPLGAGFVRRRT